MAVKRSWVRSYRAIARAISISIWRWSRTARLVISDLPIALSHMPLETARHPGRKCTGHERSRGWYLVSVQLVTPISFYLFSRKLEYLIMNKIIGLNTSIARMKMNPCEEIRRRQMPQTFQEEMKWFAKGFHQPKTCLLYTSPSPRDA